MYLMISYDICLHKNCHYKYFKGISIVKQGDTSQLKHMTMSLLFLSTFTLFVCLLSLSLSLSCLAIFFNIINFMSCFFSLFLFLRSFTYLHYFWFAYMFVSFKLYRKILFCPLVCLSTFIKIYLICWIYELSSWITTISVFKKLGNTGISIVNQSDTVAIFFLSLISFHVFLFSVFGFRRFFNCIIFVGSFFGCFWIILYNSILG